MYVILKYNLKEHQAAVQFLGQAGYLIHGCGTTIVIDPYLSNCAGEDDPLFQRQFSPPVVSQDLDADLYLVTHDHLDHLDPDTVVECSKKKTCFIAPRLAAKKLLQLGVDKKQIHIINAGESEDFGNVSITGIFALPTGTDVLDTTGYLIQFKNGRTVYHTSDTAYCDLLLQAAPKCEVLLTCINGKFGNLSIEQAVKLAKVINPRFVIPNHYDMMSGNQENPKVFEYVLHHSTSLVSHILTSGESFVWGEP